MSNQHLTLVIMAAGLGSRFGGNKQLELIPGLNKTIFELSIEDAFKAGIKDVVLIIRPELRLAIEQHIVPRLPEQVKLRFAYQTLDNVPDSYQGLINKRTKPWGTGHALLCAKHLLSNPFIVVTADDYYGKSAFKIMAEHLSVNSQWALVSYPLEKTLSKQGGVNRGICQLDVNGRLLAIEECLSILKKDQQVVGQSVQGSDWPLTGNEKVSMSFWGFTPDVFDWLERGFKQFMLDADQLDGQSTKLFNSLEYFLPDQVQQAIEQGNKTVTVLTNTEQWFGVTYREELDAVAAELMQQIAH